MIKSGHGKQNGKNAIGYLVLVLTYVLISALLSLYCLVRWAKRELQKCRPINWQLCRIKAFIKKTIKRILTPCTWSDLKRHYPGEDILQRVANLFKRRTWTPSDPKEGNIKTPKHIYIILKTSDVIILQQENKLSPYLVNIAVCLYEHKVAHMSIYVAECLFDSVFFDNLANGLHRCGFLMSASAGGVGGDMADPQNAANLFNKGAHEFTVVKCTPPQTPHTLHLTFVNKSNAHNKLIDAAEGSNITSEGDVVRDAHRHPVCNKTVEGLIRKILDFDKKMLFKEKGKTFQRVCYVVFFLFTEVKQISVTQLKRVLPSLCKKVEWVVTQIIKRITCFVTQFGVLYSPVGTGESNLWGNTPTEKKRTKMPCVNSTMEKVEKRDDFPSSEKEPEGDTKTTLALLNEFLKSSIVKDQQSIDTIKQLVENNIPLYVQPICTDIFDASFNDTQVDVVLSLRIGLTDFLAYTLTRYQKGKSLQEENFFPFLKDYFSSLFFLYNIIHPFNKDGIQPWVLSNAEVYEFFDYSVASVRQALAYYGSSLQRHGC
ncbi:Uncharacterized protein PCOAH_00011060 [Plasmodium coatneyi]|uniref:Uncharacterized protein n=1 Tax=Plasmodium coatneyi TaxID=208452 RepID=A0A1B1DW39_9APIC|nr:Uncharacterized protein PCOAH_00011060 [Plasmodium coatneyi]ANQ06795.1 Uncharacterized protein PCOAH_00011060 [Plasmodium coatneyi]